MVVLCQCRPPANWQIWTHSRIAGRPTMPTAAVRQSKLSRRRRMSAGVIAGDHDARKYRCTGRPADLARQRASRPTRPIPTFTLAPRCSPAMAAASAAATWRTPPTACATVPNARPCSARCRRLPARRFRRAGGDRRPPRPASPCGACRQVMAELCDRSMPVLLSNLGGSTRKTTVAELLPGSFKLPQKSVKKATSCGFLLSRVRCTPGLAHMEQSLA